jgi:pimeloyl-ACP methyl ester carboxylesterase
MNVQTTLDGIKSHFGIFGTGSEIVLIHGFGPSISASWGLNIKALSRSRQVIALDLPGFGESEEPQVEFSISYLSRFLNHFLYALGVKQATIVGHSLGAKVAARFAVDHPDRIRALILVAGFGPPALPVRLRLATPSFINKLLRRSNEKVVRRFVSSLFCDKQLVTDELVREFLNEAEVQGTTNPRPQFWSLLNYSFRQSELARINAPTLLVHGARDELIHAAHSMRASAFIKGSELQILPNCGHWIQREDPDTFNQMVSTFLEEHFG